MAQLSSTRGRGKRHSLHLDMTPMVDLAFLLLTFFVLTMTLNQHHILKMEMPDQDPITEPPSVRQERVLTVLLGKADSIYYFMGSDPVKVTDYGLNGIRRVISDAMTKRSDLVILIKPGAKSRYQNLVDMIDEMSFAEMHHYYLVKETAEDRQRIAAAVR